MKQITKIYGRYRKYIENIMFPMILLIYPLLKINQGIDASDTTYSLANFQYFGSMEGTWMVATFLANAVGSLLMHLPWGDTLLGMYFYTALLQSVIALAVYLGLRKKLPAPVLFLGEFMALSLCWCPSTILYNYLTYLLMTAGVLLLYCGVMQDRTAVMATYLSSEDKVTVQQAETKTKARWLYLEAGICLGANVAVRMPNVVQMAFIVVVWYGAALMCHRQNVLLTAKAGGQETVAQRCINRQTAWKLAVRDTLWCILGYVLGFGIPLTAICIKYGIDAYPAMVQTMFAMTEKAVDYKPVSMVTGMFGDYFTGLYWLLFAGICIAAGWLLMKVQNLLCPENGIIHSLCRLVYVVILTVLLRFYWGRGMFSFRYYEYSSMYYPTVLLLLMAIAAAVYCLLRRQVCTEKKILAMIVLVQIFVTPLGSNNNLYPIINNLFLVIPFLLWIACDWFLTDREQTAFGFAWKAPLAMLLLFVFVQGIGFHQNFVFQDGMQGERRTMCITAPAKAANVYTGQDNGELLQELAVFVEKENLNGRDLITYGELPGMGYLLDMPSALSTFWPDLDSYRKVEYERDMAQIETNVKQGNDETPVIILASPVAAYLSEDADGMNWFGVDRKAMDQDEKLQMLGSFMERYGYREAFCNARYAVYVTEK